MITKETLQAALESIEITRRYVGEANHHVQIKLLDAAKELHEYLTEHYPEKEEEQNDAAI